MNKDTYFNNGNCPPGFDEDNQVEKTSNKGGFMSRMFAENEDRKWRAELSSKYGTTHEQHREVERGKNEQ
jgi:hypothetical protein